MNNNFNVINLSEFPTTRYQGSKRKLLPWLFENIAPMKFESVLDIFAGTGSVSYLFKKMGKEVTFNDYLKSNYFTGKALIENESVILENSDIAFLLTKHKTINYKTFVQDTFSGIYYLDIENAWIDKFLGNWNNLSNIYSNEIAEYKKAIAFHAFAQSALKKRPFNLFHRANLNLRLNNVKRTFGNKVSWEGSFDNYFKEFVLETNNSIFGNKKNNKALNYKFPNFEKTKRYDLIYIDPPYIKENRRDASNKYFCLYHFLEGASDLVTWGSRINYSSRNLRIEEISNEWATKEENILGFKNLFNSFKESIIVVSYKEPGIPSKRELINLLKKYKTKIISVPGQKYSYALNKNNGYHKEYLLIGI